MEALPAHLESLEHRFECQVGSQGIILAQGQEHEFFCEILKVMGELELPQGEDLEGQVHGGLGQDHSGLHCVTSAKPGGSRGDFTVLFHPLGLNQFFEDIRANHPRHMPAGIAGLSIIFKLIYLVYKVVLIIL